MTSEGRSRSRSSGADVNGCGHVCCRSSADYEHAQRPEDCGDCAEVWSDAQADAAMQAMDAQ